MNQAIDMFRLNIGYVRNLGAIYSFIKAQTTQALDISDILRAEFVFAVSALDLYIHEMVRIGMLESYRGTRTATNTYFKFDISLESAIQGINFQGDDWLDNEIRIRHGWRSFQHADKISDCIRLISDINIWEEVSKIIGGTAGDNKIRLNLIVERRNKISHEADIDPSFPGSRWPIDEKSVNETIDFIEQTAEAIYAIIKI